LATIAVAYDNAHFEPRPVEWQLPKIWIISVVLGALLALGTWVIRGMLFLPDGGIIQHWGSVQEILFLEISLTENWLIFVTRGSTTYPSWQLVGAILAVDIISTLFCIFGWLSGQAIASDPATNNKLLSTNGATDVVTVVIIWCYSIGVTIIIAMVYYLLNRIRWLNDLGRKNRSQANAKLENVIGYLSKLAIEHEKSADGKERYQLTNVRAEEEDME
jgi:H+-transporting ATPase